MVPNSKTLENRYGDCVDHSDEAVEAADKWIEWDKKRVKLERELHKLLNQAYLP
jgi:hypothetical protein